MILAVGPHPDDVEWGAGAMLAGQTIYVAAGCSDQRRQEALAAAQVLDADLLVGPAKDRQVAASADLLLAEVEGLLLGGLVDTVLMPPLGDAHQDHAAVAEVVLRAARRLPLQVAEYETPSAPPGWAPNWYVRVDATHAGLMEAAVAEHQTQADHQYMTGGLAVARLKAAGWRVGADFAVPLRLVRGVTQMPD